MEQVPVAVQHPAVNYLCSFIKVVHCVTAELISNLYILYQSSVSGRWLKNQE